MKRRISLALSVVALLGLSTRVKAEIVDYGDGGHFCTSKGYLAFDYNQNGKPLLEVVRFGPEGRIYFAVEASLPEQFKVWWMACEAERVEVAGLTWPRGMDGPITRCDVEAGPRTTNTGSAECVDDAAYVKPLTATPRLEVRFSRRT
jgi:hypothetical protein